MLFKDNLGSDAVTTSWLCALPPAVWYLASKWIHLSKVKQTNDYNHQLMAPRGILAGTYSKTCVKWPLSIRPKSGFQDQLSLNAGQKYCQGVHSAILLTFIRLLFVSKIFVLSIFEWSFYTGLNLNVHADCCAFVCWLCFVCVCFLCLFFICLLCVLMWIFQFIGFCKGAASQSFNNAFIIINWWQMCNFL